MKQSEWVRGFKFGFKVQRGRDRLIDFLAGAMVGVIITILVVWL